MPTGDNESLSPSGADEDRRKFLASCGKFAIVTPPAITMLLSTSLNSSAIARSGGGNGNRDGGGHKQRDWNDWLDNLLDNLWDHGRR